MTDEFTPSAADRTDPEAEASNARTEPSTQGHASGVPAVIGQAGEVVIVNRPAPGQTVEIQAVATQTYLLDFPPGEAQVRIDEATGNLILGFDDDGDGTADSRIVFLDMVALVDAGQAPTFQVGNVEIAGELLVAQALALAGEEESSLETAVGETPTSGGTSEYSDDFGQRIDLLDAEGVIPPTELEFGLIDLENEITLLDDEDGPPLADPVLTPAEQGDLPEGLQDVLAILDGDDPDGEAENRVEIAFFKQLDVDGEIGDDDTGTIADFGGADAETALGDLVFTLLSPPTFGVLILDAADGTTSFLTVGDTFSSDDTVWWIATADQVEDFLNSNELQILPDVEFDYSVTDAAGNVATAPVVITIDREVLPPDVDLAFYGGNDCIEEDSTTSDSNNLVALDVAAQDDDEITEIVISGLQSDWTYDFSGLEVSGATLTDDDPSDGSITLSVPNLANYNGTFAVQPPPDSDVDHPTITATATVVDSLEPGLSASAEDNLNIDVDAVADGAEGSFGDDFDGVHLSVSANVVDSDDDGDSFQPGETGTLNIQATFDDFLDGSEIHTLTVEAPDGFSIGEIDEVALPAGVTLTSNDGTTAIFDVETEDGVGSVDFDLSVTNDSAEDGTAEFTVKASAQETTTDEEDCDPENNFAEVEDPAPVTVANVAPPDVALAFYGGNDCIEEDSTASDPNNLVTLNVTPQGDDLLTEIVLEGFQPDWTYDLTGLDTDGLSGGVVVTDNIAGDGTVAITFSPGTNLTYSGEFSVQPPANSDEDHPTITATATVTDPVDLALTDSGSDTFDIPVDAVIDGSEVEQTTPAEGDENTTIDLNLEIDLGGDSTSLTGTTSPDPDQPATQGGTDKDGSESINRLVVTLSLGALGWVLPASIAEPGESPDGTWTFDTSGADLADVQSLVASLSVTPPADFDGEIDVTVTTTTAEAATEAGPNGLSGEECDDDNNVDVDSYEFTVIVNSTVDPVLVVGENVDDDDDNDVTVTHRVDTTSDQDVDGSIVGDEGGDVLIGDVGGSDLVNKTMNLVLVLDTSNSMEEQIDFGGESIRRIEALDRAVEQLLDDIVGTAGVTVRLHMISFADDVKKVGTFDIITDGEPDDAALQDAKNFILAAGDDPLAVAQGDTNYEAGFNAALDWFSDDDNTLDNPNINKTIFISDGAPNRAYSGNTTEVTSIRIPNQDALDHVLGDFVGSNPDNFSEFDALKGDFKGVAGTVDAIGINVDEAADDLLDQVDDDGDADNIDDGEELADVLGNLTQVTNLEDVGNDVIVGNGGDDLIFGDTLFTDLLADDEPIDLAPGSGWAVMEELIAGGSFNADPSKTETEEILDFLRDPANQADYDFGRESVTDSGARRDGGADEIDGGDGNDTIFGQEGADVIDGGDGDDVIVGGTGDDSMTGGAGADTFVWTDQFIAGESDTVAGFESGSDALDVTELLDGETPGADGSELDDYLNITFAGGNTTIGVDVDGDGSGFTDVTIVVEGVDLTGGSVVQEDIINNLLASGDLAQP